jgi:hypothetical protein
LGLGGTAPFIVSPWYAIVLFAEFLGAGQEIDAKSNTIAKKGKSFTTALKN